jgi:hypothetical protein
MGLDAFLLRFPQQAERASQANQVRYGLSTNIFDSAVALRHFLPAYSWHNRNESGVAVQVRAGFEGMERWPKSCTIRGEH